MYPFALRKGKIVHNFGLSECNRVKRKELALRLDPLPRRETKIDEYAHHLDHHEQCSAETFHNWGQCPRALENVGTFEKKAGTLCEK